MSWAAAAAACESAQAPGGLGQLLAAAKQQGRGGQGAKRAASASARWRPAGAPHQQQPAARGRATRRSRWMDNANEGVPLLSGALDGSSDDADDFDPGTNPCPAPCAPPHRSYCVAQCGALVRASASRLRGLPPPTTTVSRESRGRRAPRRCVSAATLLACRPGRLAERLWLGGRLGAEPRRTRWRVAPPCPAPAAAPFTFSPVA